MPLTLLPARREDIPRLVEILFLAFAHDPLLMTCYPSTPSNHAWWTQTMLHQMEHPSTIVMKIDDSETEETVSFAKWHIHQESSDGTPGETTQGAVQPTNPSPDMNVSACNSLATAQYTMRESVISARPHICKSMAPEPNPYIHTYIHTQMHR